MLTSTLALAVLLPAALTGAHPVLFEENRGQAPDDVRFVARPPGYRLEVTAGAARFVLPGGEEVLLLVEGGGPAEDIEPGARAPGVVHHYRGADPARWVEHVPLFESVTLRGVRPGVDLVLRDGGGALEFELVLSPGVDADRVRVRFAGAESVEEVADGALQVAVPGGALTLAAPVVLERTGAGLRRLDARYDVEGRAIGFAVAGRDPARTLVIDPVVGFSSVYGGSQAESFVRGDVDEAGRPVVAGRTQSLDLPLASAHQSAHGDGGPGSDAFVAKLTVDGAGLVFATYLGGGGSDAARDVAVIGDGSGEIVVVGDTSSADFPVTTGPPLAIADGFVARFAADGTLVSSRRLGSSGGADAAHGAAGAANGDAFVVGTAEVGDFPVTAGAFQTVKGFGRDAFVARVDRQGVVVAATFLGAGTSAFQENLDEAYAVAVDVAGRPCVLGETRSPNFPIAGGVVQSSLAGGAGDQDLFVARLSTDLSALLDSTLLGGTKDDEADGASVAVDAQGRVLLAAGGASADLPATPGALKPAPTGKDAYLARIDFVGGLDVGTYFGGSGGESVGGVAADPDGGIWIAGTTGSGDLPLADPVQAAHASLGSATDGFAAKLTADGGTIAFSTYLGGGGTTGDAASDIVAGPLGRAFAFGDAGTDFGATPGALDHGSSSGAFVVAIDLAWSDLGSGLAGTAGVPRLRGAGTLAPATPVTVSLDSARPSAAFLLFVGLSAANLPALGGTLVPAPDLVIAGLATDPAGEAVLAGAWPSGLPSAASVFLQAWIADPLAPFGAAASNGLEGTTP